MIEARILHHKLDEVRALLREQCRRRLTARLLLVAALAAAVLALALPHLGPQARPLVPGLAAALALVALGLQLWIRRRRWSDTEIARLIEARHPDLNALLLTAVEHRDAMRPIEVVWHLRSIKFRRFLRIKAEIAKDGKTPLAVPSVWGIWKGADWLERECYDMFGIRFEGHPDLRRILMWEQYKEGFPLRKDFPMRGRFSRSEQLKQALAANPEARYSMEELSIADAFEDLPSDMRHRLTGGDKTGE